MTPPLSPRKVADKSRKGALVEAIRMALSVESPAVRHNTQTFNRGRYQGIAGIPDYESLKDEARAIKERSIAALPELLARLRSSVEGRGGHFHLAKDGAEASNIISELCRRRGAKLAVKGKSMTSEEVHLNSALERAGVEVVETDLAEFILQVADEQPSHIIAPAVHYSRERITALFQRVFKTGMPLDTGEELTRFAREKLREKFLAADVGISGANFIAADSGSIVLVESEANIRLTAQLPPLHIAIAGIEKIVPSRADFGPFLELLAPSATGQPLSSYTTVISPPLASPPDGDPSVQREFHLVVVDNGRMKMRDDPVLHEALYCIRCSACLNSCANFQTVGGHAFGGQTYSGGIGGSWETGTRGLEYARFSELCTGCSRCIPQCPVRIDIPWLNTQLRSRLNRYSGTAEAQGMASRQPMVPAADKASAQKFFFGRYDLAGEWGSGIAALVNWMNRVPLARRFMESMMGVDRRRKLPPFAVETLEASAISVPELQKPAIARAVLFADQFTNFSSPQRGLAALRVLREAGVDVVVSASEADGRAPLSQGMTATAAAQASRTGRLLAAYINDGREVVAVEPSVLAMFRLDYRHFLDSEAFTRIREHSFDAVEFLWNLTQQHGLDLAAIFPAERHPRGRRVFYHSHCQQRTIGAAAQTVSLLRACGFDVVTSEVECCGMAGSFGYKREFYDLSMAVGAQLFDQARAAEADGGPRILVATGTSCQEQLNTGLGREAIHPMELLAGTLT